MLNANPTTHGNNIAEQINNEDAYGSMDDLTLFDLWNIVDELYSHVIDSKSLGYPVSDILERCMNSLEKLAGH